MARFAAPRATADVAALARTAGRGAGRAKGRQPAPDARRRPIAVNRLLGAPAPIYAYWMLRAALPHVRATSQQLGALRAPLKT